MLADGARTHTTHTHTHKPPHTPLHTRTHAHTHTRTSIDIWTFAPPWLCDSIHCESLASQVLLKEAAGPIQLDTCGSLQCCVERLWTALSTIPVLHLGPLRSIWLASSLHQMPMWIAFSPHGYTSRWHLLCQLTNLSDKVGQICQCKWWPCGSLMCTICYVCVCVCALCVHWRQNTVLGIRVFFTLFLKSSYTF